MLFMAPGNDFNRSASGLLELLQQRVHLLLREFVAPGMRQHRHAASADDPVNGIGQTGPLVRHEARLAGREETPKHPTDIFCQAARHHRACEVGASNHVLVFGQCKRIFEKAR